MNKDIELLAEQLDIPMIPESVNFWFIRTNGGEKYKEFFFGNYVAIGWDRVGTINAIKKHSHDQLKARVEEVYPDNSRPGYVANQLEIFVRDIKKGDYVVIPSVNSDVLAFGVITSDVYEYAVDKNEEYYNINIDSVEPDFLKRHDVEWFDSKKRESLDPYLYRIIYSHNTIVDANPYAQNILRNLFDQYIYEGKLRSVIRVTTEENISGIALSKLIANSISYIEEVSGEAVTDENLEMKISLNSPGIIEIATAVMMLMFGTSMLGIMLAGGKVKYTNKFKDFENAGEFETRGLLEAVSKYIKNNSQTKYKSIEKELELSKKKLKIEQKSKE